MQRIDIILALNASDVYEPPSSGRVRFVLHRWVDGWRPPPAAGEMIAFIDWLAPQMAGLEICRRLRSAPETASAHITMVLDEDDPDAKRRALRAGADDYMNGPATIYDLLARVIAAERHESREIPLPLVLGELTLDFGAYRASYRGAPIPLMRNQFRLLQFLMEHPGRVFSRAQLIAALGRQDTPIDRRTVDVWIGRLRRALCKAGADEMLRTVRSVGYVLDLPAKATPAHLVPALPERTP